MGRRAFIVLVCVAPALLIAGGARGGVSASASPVVSTALEQPRGPAQTGTICLVCGQPVGEGDVCVLYRGRRVPLHAGECVAVWNADPEALFASLQPRGALFDEPEGPTSPLRRGWLFLGCYVVLGLLAGALCAYVAVARALQPLPWFFAGLVANVLALGVLLTRRPGDASVLPAGVPPGLTKVPTTRPPKYCPACGGENHPSARACAGCGAALEPAVDPETARL